MLVRCRASVLGRRVHARAGLQHRRGASTDPAVSSPRGRHAAAISWLRLWRRRESKSEDDRFVEVGGGPSASVNTTISGTSEMDTDLGTSVAVCSGGQNCSNCSRTLSEVEHALAELHAGRLDLAISRLCAIGMNAELRAEAGIVPVDDQHTEEEEKEP